VEQFATTHLSHSTVWVKKILLRFLTFFPNAWELFNQFYTPTIRSFLH